MIERLSEAARETALKTLPGWQLSADGKAIERVFRFVNFGQAFAFMTQVALAAEKLDHHPEWRNVWNRVEVRLTTHDVDGLSGRDIDLATLIEGILGTA